MYQICQTRKLIINNKYLNVYGYNFSQEIKKKQMTEEIIQEKETRVHLEQLENTNINENRRIKEKQ